MSFVCLWSPAWRTGAASLAELAPTLLAHAPRIATGVRGQCWADARGLDATSLAHALTDAVRGAGHAEARAGVADTPVGAALAAVHAATAGPAVTLIAPGGDRAFLASLPLSVLSPSPPLAALLEGVGLETCAALAQLDGESVEVRLGSEGRHVWRLARGDDPRLLFSTPPHPLPSASFDWEDYTLTDVERLLFIINALAGNVCTALAERGQRARVVTLAFSLIDRTRATRTLDASRPSASQQTWMRMIRSDLERVTLAAAVSGIAVRVELITGNDGPQGDLFDHGFASGPAVERALGELVDAQGEILVAPSISEHPLLDRREKWVFQDVEKAVEQQGTGNRRQGTGREKQATGNRRQGTGGVTGHRSQVAEVPVVPALRLVGSVEHPSTRGPSPVAPPVPCSPFPVAYPAQPVPCSPFPVAYPAQPVPCSPFPVASPSFPVACSLQLLPSPAPISVTTTRRRDHDIPLRYRDAGKWYSLLQVAGPDRVSGGEWESAYAREYFRCVREDGMLVWIFRDQRPETRDQRTDQRPEAREAWYLHGWWD